MTNEPTYNDLQTRIRKLERNATYYRLIADNATDMISKHDPEGVYVYASPAAHGLCGYSCDELVGRSAFEFLHPRDFENIRTSHRKILSADIIDRISYQIRHKLGHYIWVETTSRAIKNPDTGEIEEIIATTRDITERKLAEEGLETQNRLMSTLLENLQVGVFMVDAPTGKPLLANRRAEELLGRGIMHGTDKTTLAEVYHAYKLDSEEFYPQNQMPIVRGIQGESHSVDDMVVVHPDGSRVILEVFGSPVKDKQGNVIAALASFSDITDRKRTEEILRSSQKRFLTVLDSIDATIYAADMETYEILFMNQNMIDVFGNMIGELCWDVFRGQSGPCRHCTNDQLVGENGNPTGVCIWQDENPVSKKWYINYDRAIEWTDGRLVRLQIATDITQIKQMERQLQQTQKFEAIGTLAGGIAHDFNNLLMGIQGRASLMLVDLEPSHPHAEHINAIEDYIRSATDLTRQLLGFARGGKYEVKPTDINELVSNSANMFGRTKKEIRIHTKLRNPPPVVAVDRRQIEQVLLNLYVNAWQAMPNGGELYLETKIATPEAASTEPSDSTSGRYAHVAVTDTGIGMDEATQQRIFDPFFTTKEKGRGTGLGLASAYGIIKNHDGIIAVSSQIGHGTTFNIYLPLSQKGAHREAPMIGELIKGSETVLIVDDEEMILEVGQAMLEKLGYRVFVARGGEQAIDIIKREECAIDLIILDLIMPDMDGGTVFDRARELRPQIPVMLSSGYAINDQAEEIMKRGCNGFIQKPFRIADLSKILRTILDATTPTK